jgi:hypothetical protein
MDAQDVLFVLFGFQITIASIFTAAGGLLTVGLGAYKLVDYLRTRERRRLDMLREYLDREEKNITGRRSDVLSSIRLSEHAYLSEKKLDVGAEIDRAVDLLDRGYPQAAAAKLDELEKRLLVDERMLRKRGKTCSATQKVYAFSSEHLLTARTTRHAVSYTSTRRSATMRGTSTLSSIRRCYCSTRASWTMRRKRLTDCDRKPMGTRTPVSERAAVQSKGSAGFGRQADRALRRRVLPSLCSLCRFLGRLHDAPSTRADGRRPRSARARNRG